MDFIDLISNTDEFLSQLVASNLFLTYLVVFTIIFCESGIILCPYLPGDGLLFSVGVVAATTSLNVFIIVPLLIIAAITGFLFNYKMGNLFGRWVVQKNISFLMKPYEKTHIFISRHGNKAVVISRFFPILRTYLPFVAGAVSMNYTIFLSKTISGAILWVCLFVFTGYFTGELEWVKNNYGFIFLGLIVITLIPLFFQLAKALVKMTKATFFK